MTAPTLAFLDFCRSLDAVDSREFGDDVDLIALGRLTGDERRRAEEMLRARLTPDSRDARVPRALVHLLGDAAIAPLQQALAVAGGHARVSCAQALAGADRGFDPVPHFLAVLADRSSSGRSAAAAALAGCREPRALEALVLALQDDTFRPRLAPFNALVISLGLESLRLSRYGRLRELSACLASDLPSVVREAVGAVSDAVSALRAGRSPESLGLAESACNWEADLDRVFDALWRDTDPEASMLDAIQGPGRRVLESLLLYEIRRDDPRVPRVLARIGTQRAVAALEDAQQIRLERSGAEVAAALEVLRARLAAS